MLWLDSKLFDYFKNFDLKISEVDNLNRNKNESMYFKGLHGRSTKVKVAIKSVKSIAQYLPIFPSPAIVIVRYMENKYK